MNQKYTVKAGDTLYGISNQFGVSVTDLASLNNVNANTLKVGQVLTIPNNAGTNPSNMFMYTVKKGDTLYSIAQKYNTTVGQIVSLNYLKSNDLSVGQVLRIPETYTSEDDMVIPVYKNYTVKRGDSLYSIARDNGISVDTLMKDNGLTNVSLSIGQILRIRVPDQLQVIEECYGEDFVPPESSTYINYTVKKGDNLYSIAKKFNTSVTAIKNLNGISSNNISIGQVLKIPSVYAPSNNSSVSTYTVKSGDSLYSIAKKFNTSVDSIKKKNNLSNNLLNIGQKIII